MGLVAGIMEEEAVMTAPTPPTWNERLTREQILSMRDEELDQLNFGEGSNYDRIFLQAAQDAAEIARLSSALEAFRVWVVEQEALWQQPVNEREEAMRLTFSVVRQKLAERATGEGTRP